MENPSILAFPSIESIAAGVAWLGWLKNGEKAYNVCLLLDLVVIMIVVRRESSAATIAWSTKIGCLWSTYI